MNPITVFALAASAVAVVALLLIVPGAVWAAMDALRAVCRRG